MDGLPTGDLEQVYTSRGRDFLFAVETSHEHADYQKYEDLRYAVWEEPADRMPGNRNMVCENYFNDGSALFIGVFVPDSDGRFVKDGEHLVGFSYGFTGVRDKTIGFRHTGNLMFYSQYTAVREGWHRFGLGLEIKRFQKKVLTGVFGIRWVSCTFDPLTGVNARRNVRELGMIISEYRVAHYGEFGGRLNRRDIPCDRFYALWDLGSEPRIPSSDPKGPDLGEITIFGVDLQPFPGKTGSHRLEVPGESLRAPASDVVAVEIPVDFYAMLRETDVDDERTRRLPLEWRLITRRAFQDCFARGYTVRDFRTIEAEGRKRNFYVLEREKASGLTAD